MKTLFFLILFVLLCLAALKPAVVIIKCVDMDIPPTQSLNCAQKGVLK